MVKVFNLSIGEYVSKYSCTPRQAVMAAYAQSKGNWNTWDYEKLYGHLVTEGQKTIACGDFSALKTV